MTLGELKEFVEKDEDLNDLLIKQKIYLNTKFSDSRYDNEALKAYISDDYYKSFEEIFKNINGKKKSVVVTLLKSIDFLATAELRNKIIEVHIIPTLQQSVSALTDLKDNINGNNLEPYFEPIDEALSSPIFQMINQFEREEKVRPYRANIIDLCLDICDQVADVNPRSETMKYAVYNVIINNIKKVKNFGAFQERYDKHREKITVTRDNIDNKYLIWVIIIVIIFVLRLIARLT